MTVTARQYILTGQRREGVFAGITSLLDKLSMAAGIAGNSRLDTLQAAILLAKLPRLEDWIGARNAHARRYRAGLDGLVKLPPEAPGVRPIDSPFVIRVETGRDRLQKRLDEAGIDCPFPTQTLNLQIKSEAGEQISQSFQGEKRKPDGA